MVDLVCLGLICSRIPNLINFWTNQFTLFLILFYLSKFDSFSFCQKSVFKFRFAKAIKAILGPDMALNQSTSCICKKSPAPCPTIKKSEQIQKSIYIVQPNFLSLPWSSAFLRWPQKFPLSALWFWRLLSKCQNHKADRANICYQVNVKTIRQVVQIFVAFSEIYTCAVSNLQMYIYSQTWL